MNQMEIERCIVWSGGYDSTALLLDAVNDGASLIKTISFSLGNNVVQREQEKISRDNIMRAIQGHHGVVIDNEVIDIAELPLQERSGMLLAQAMIWFTSIAIRPARHYQFGYVRRDDFWHYKSQFLQLVSQVNELRDVKLEVSFPYEWETKESLIERYSRSSFNLHILGMVSVSEHNHGWYDGGKHDEKNMEIRSLWERALEDYSLKRLQSNISVCKAADPESKVFSLGKSLQV